MNYLPQLLLSLTMSFADGEPQVPVLPAPPGAPIPLPPSAPLPVLPMPAPQQPVQQPIQQQQQPQPERQPLALPSLNTPSPSQPMPLPDASPQVPGYGPLGPREKLQPEADPSPPVACAQPEVLRHTQSWPEVWGFGGFAGMFGNRMAPNGVPFDPVFDIQGQINFGFLPDKKLYFFADMDFWGQAPGAAVTNPLQGSFDFSKREWDFDLGLAWNYWDSMEFRVYGYALNNLNRGTSQISPYGYNDGWGIENRYYFANADKYDVGKLSFLSIGYLPSNSLTGQDGLMFHPGFTARAYLTCDIPMLRSYLYFDGKYFADNTFMARLLEYDAGVAVRPWESLQNLEFRLGGSGVYDVQYRYDRSIGYLSVRLQF